MCRTIWRARLMVLAAGAGLLSCPNIALAQRAGGAPVGAGNIPGMSRPGGVSEKDELKDFHEAMAVQATSEQVAEFAALARNTEAASKEFEDLVKGLEKGTDASNVPLRAAALRQAMERARSETKDFLAGFSLAQKSGLKELTAKLMKTESDLAEQEKILVASTSDAKEEGAQIAGRAEGLRKALAAFRREQDNLALEMGIVQSDAGQNVAFNIPPNKISANIAGQPVAVTTSAAIFRAASEGGENVFNVEATSDLTDLQGNLTGVLAAQLNKAERCGEKIGVHDATLTPSIPSALAVVQLHYERWFCSRAMGPESPREVAEANATVEVKLTPAVGPNGQLQITAEIAHVNAERFLADLLHTGALGDELREKISRSVLAGIVNLKTVLPPAVAASAQARSARFASAREGELSVVVTGEMKISAEQTRLLASQLKQRLASQASGAQTAPLQSR